MAMELRVDCKSQVEGEGDLLQPYQCGIVCDEKLDNAVIQRKAHSKSQVVRDQKHML